ncbi:MAG: hypothetical protein AAF411_26395 [Myxococcota bacterium]
METGLLSVRMRRTVLVLGAISVLGTVGALLYGQKLHGITPGMSDSYGRGPIGHRAFAETLQRLGYYVAQNRGSRFDGTESPMWFLEPKPTGRTGGFDRELSEAMEARATERLPTVLVLPKWILTPSTTETPNVLLDSVSPGLVLDAVAPEMEYVVGDSGRQVLTGVLGEFEVQVPRLQVFTRVAPYDEVLLDGPEGAVVVRNENGAIIISDPDFFHSFNLHRADHAALTLAVVERGFGSRPDTIVLDEVFHGHGMQYSLAEALGEFPNLLLVVHFLLLALALIAAGSVRFGPPRRGAKLGDGTGVAVEVSAGVLAEGQHAGAILLEYVQEVVLHTYDTLGLGTAQTLDESARALDEAAERRALSAGAVALVDEARRAFAQKRWTPELFSIAERAHAFRSMLLHSKHRKSNTSASRAVSSKANAA